MWLPGLKGGGCQRIHREEAKEQDAAAKDKADATDTTGGEAVNELRLTGHSR